MIQAYTKPTSCSYGKGKGQLNNDHRLPCPRRGVEQTLPDLVDRGALSRVGRGTSMDLRSSNDVCRRTARIPDGSDWDRYDVHHDVGPSPGLPERFAPTPDRLPFWRKHPSPPHLHQTIDPAGASRASGSTCCCFCSCSAAAAR